MSSIKAINGRTSFFRFLFCSLFVFSLPPSLGSGGGRGNMRNVLRKSWPKSLVAAAAPLYNIYIYIKYGWQENIKRPLRAITPHTAVYNTGLQIYRLIAHESLLNNAHIRRLHNGPPAAAVLLASASTGFVLPACNYARLNDPSPIFFPPK